LYCEIKLRILSICLDASVDQFLGNGDSIDYSQIIELMNMDPIFHEEFFAEKVMDCLISKKELTGCIILNCFLNQQNLHSHLLREEFISNTEKGIIDYLLKMMKLVSNQNQLFPICCIIFKDLLSLGREDEMNLVLNEIIESLKNEDSNLNSDDSNILTFMNTLNLITEIDSEIRLDLKHFLEFIINRHENYLFHFASVLVFYNSFNDDLPILIEKLMEIISSDKVEDMNEPFSFFENIVRMIKKDFSPWVSKAFKSSVTYLNNHSISYSMMSVISFLNALVETFGEECEIYITKYNLIPLIIQIIHIYSKSSFDLSLLSIPFRFLTDLSFFKMKSLITHVPSILKELKSIQRSEKMFY
jgi:uncharacterized Tic20 family protein